MKKVDEQGEGRALCPRIKARGDELRVMREDLVVKESDGGGRGDRF